MSGIGTDTGEHPAITPQDPEGSDIYVWRLDQLLQAGYSELNARKLAARAEVDLHQACDLLARGCPEETAFAILA
jgi:hypothetical protein